jgi:hypothetical protein
MIIDGLPLAGNTTQISESDENLRPNTFGFSGSQMRTVTGVVPIVKEKKRLICKRAQDKNLHFPG